MSANHSNSPSQAETRRALRILAKSVYRELKAGGYDRSQMVGFTSELIDIMTHEVQESAAI